MRIDFGALMREETAMRWDFLNEESEPCAVVTDRMELVYVNEACQAIVPADWFAKRCFEVLPAHDALCAMDCPTIAAVQTADGIACTEEVLDTDDGATVHLSTAVIPMHDVAGDAARAILLFRVRPQGSDARFEQALRETAEQLSERAHEAVLRSA